MRKHTKKIVLGLSLFTLVTLALGKFFDSRCPSRSCIGEVIAAESFDGEKTWKRFNIIINDKDSISFKADGTLDDGDDNGTNIIIGEGDLGGDEDNPARVKEPIKVSFDSKNIKEINLKNYVTDWKFSISPDDKITFVFKGYIPDKDWTVKESGETLKMDMSKKGPLQGELLLPKDFKGTLMVANNSGDFEVENLGNVQTVIMQNVSGDVKFKSLPTASLDLNTVNGDVAMEPTSVNKDLKFDLNTVSGDLALSLPSSIKALHINSVSADVELTVTKNVGFNFVMEGVSASFEGLPKNTQEVDSIAHRGAKGSFGSDPKGELNFSTVSGNFRLERAD